MSVGVPPDIHSPHRPPRQDAAAAGFDHQHDPVQGDDPRPTTRAATRSRCATPATQTTRERTLQGRRVDRRVKREQRRGDHVARSSLELGLRLSTDHNHAPPPVEAVDCCSARHCGNAGRARPHSGPGVSPRLSRAMQMTAERQRTVGRLQPPGDCVIGTTTATSGGTLARCEPRPRPNRHL